MPMNSVGIKHLIEHPQANLFAKPGTGKTAMTLTALTVLDAAGEDVFPALIVAPLRVARSVWAEEAAKWEHTKHLRVVKVIGAREKREHALAQDADVYVINFENMEWLDRVNHKQFRTLIVDESSKLRGCRAQIKHTKTATFFARGGTVNASAIAHLGLKIPRHINLTGTPSVNGLDSLWGQQFVLDYGTRLGRTHGGFQSRWFRQIRNDNHFLWRPFDHSFDEITKAIADVTCSIDPADYEDLRELRTVDVLVDMPPACKRVYARVKSEAKLEISGADNLIFSSMAVSAKLAQVASGFAYFDGTHELHEAKLEALDDLIAEINAPVIVAYHYQAELARLRKRYPQARELPKDEGGQKATEAAWNRGEIPILLVHPMSAGHGINLQYGGCDMVLLNPTWDLEPYLQVIERIGPTRQMHAGFDRQVSVYRIAARGTVDVQMLQRYDQKASLQEAVMDALS